MGGPNVGHPRTPCWLVAALLVKRLSFHVGLWTRTRTRPALTQSDSSIENSLQAPFWLLDPVSPVVPRRHSQSQRLRVATPPPAFLSIESRAHVVRPVYLHRHVFVLHDVMSPHVHLFCCMIFFSSVSSPSFPFFGMCVLFVLSSLLLLFKLHAVRLTSEERRR